MTGVATYWAGLKPEDFELYTTYENTGYCKPNPKYYQDILERLDLTAQECMMVGNDIYEYKNGSFAELMEVLK